MQIHFLCPLWGRESDDFDKFLDDVVTSGYDGVELPFSSTDAIVNQKLVEKILARDLIWVGQNWRASGSEFTEHKKIQRKFLMELAELKPLFINSHTGKDYFDFDQNMELINDAEKVAQKTSIKVLHETHRTRFNFAAHVTKTFLQTNSNIRLTADISHWCNVAESLLEDQHSLPVFIWSDA